MNSSSVSYVLGCLASCPFCGALVLARAFPEKSRWLTVVWDPSLVERVRIRAARPEDSARQGFGPIGPSPHHCRPIGERTLKPTDRWGEGRFKWN